VVVLVVAAGRTASCVVVVVLVVTGSSCAQEARKRPAVIENSEVKMVSFFMIRWFFLRTIRRKYHGQMY
jgi:hypothetical protein